MCMCPRFPCVHTPLEFGLCRGPHHLLLTTRKWPPSLKSVWLAERWISPSPGHAHLRYPPPKKILVERKKAANPKAQKRQFSQIHTLQNSTPGLSPNQPGKEHPTGFPLFSPETSPHMFHQVTSPSPHNRGKKKKKKNISALARLCPWSPKLKHDPRPKTTARFGSHFGSSALRRRRTPEAWLGEGRRGGGLPQRRQAHPLGPQGDPRFRAVGSASARGVFFFFGGGGRGRGRMRPVGFRV